MATYVPNASDTSQPTGDKKVASAAPEFRAIKVLLDATADALTNFQTQLDALEAAIGAGDNSVALAANLASIASPSLGARLVGFIWGHRYPESTIGWGAYTASSAVNVLRYIPEAEWDDIFDYTSTYDATADINLCLSENRYVFMPSGGFVVDPDIGLIYHCGQVIDGAGRNSTLILPLPKGGTSAQLAAYAKGSILKRKFNIRQTVTGGAWPITTYVSTDGAVHKFRLLNNSVTDHSAKTATISGTDINGAIIGEVINMPTGTSPGSTVISALSYLTVTSITPSATIGADQMFVGLENPYVTDCIFRNFGIVTNHPSASITATDIQIGVDLRNTTRSLAENLHVGNYAPVGSGYTKAVTTSYALQGYGVVCGTTSGFPDYAGGEVNTVRRCALWGNFKGTVQDDLVLSPLSSAHQTTVENCDMQAAHQLLSQESAYGTGCVWRGNTLQQAVPQPGNANPVYVMMMGGYNNQVYPGYLEAGSSSTYIFRFINGSRNNYCELGYYSATNAALITDSGAAGSKNTLKYAENTLAGGPGTVDSFGRPIWLYNKAYKRAWVKFHWTGAAVVIDGGQGISTVVRNGLGDYLLTYDLPFQTADLYKLDFAVDTNASGHLGTVVVISHSASNVRISTSSQNGAVTSVIDSRFVWVGAEQ